MIEKKQYNSKWFKVGLNGEQYKKLFNKMRLRAKQIIKLNHEEEYIKIFRKLMEDEYKRLEANINSDEEPKGLNSSGTIEIY